MSEETAKSDGIVVRLRLTPNEISDLRETAKAHDRTVPAEITYCLRGGVAAARPSPFATWPAAEAETFEQFGEIAARLLAEVTTAAGTKTSLRERLGFMRAALPALLDELGASVPDEEDESYFRSRAKDYLLDETRKHFAAIAMQHGAEAKYVESDLARLFHDLKAKTDKGEGN